MSAPGCAGGGSAGAGSAGARVVALAGGVGGAKLAAGLAAHLGARLTVVVNTADDLERYGLSIWPDHDTVVYTLAGLDDRERGWGLRDETWAAMGTLERLGAEPWFRLGDRDLGTHLFRTERLAAGRRPTHVALEIQRGFGLTPRVLPMADEPVRTRVRTDEGWLPFQDYFVRRHQEPIVHEVAFDGIEAARPTPEVLAAIAGAQTIVVCPSNPFVSIGPILAVPGLREAVADRRAAGVRVVAVSPIVGGRALKGPADRMLAALGHESSAVGVARLYVGLVDVLVIDEVDRSAAAAISALGIEPVVGPTVMTDDDSRAAVGSLVLSAARRATTSA
ncbi:MAG TPA: 2-phospho-L-lactate transferase [Candidatus Limnocylindrales bacterium]|nr:2-phospho-L-lactate transferase [Candidatus Limnocylindrales bacterium]